MHVIRVGEKPTKESMSCPLIFLAGGIHACPDWQKKVVNNLSDLNITIFNPRDPDNGEDVIKNFGFDSWTENWMKRADLVVFWFCKETTQHKWIFHLGRFSERSNVVVVGFHPEYRYKEPIRNLFMLSRLRSNFVDSLDSLIERIRAFIFICFT